VETIQALTYGAWIFGQAENKFRFAIVKSW
jgi:hypothetical protein